MSEQQEQASPQAAKLSEVDEWARANGIEMRELTEEERNTVAAGYKWGYVDAAKASPVAETAAQREARAETLGREFASRLKIATVPNDPSASLATPPAAADSPREEE